MDSFFVKFVNLCCVCLCKQAADVGFVFGVFTILLGKLLLTTFYFNAFN